MVRLLNCRPESRFSAQHQQPEQLRLNRMESTNELRKRNLSDEELRDFKTGLVEKIDMLEGKINALSSSTVFTPQSRRRREVVDASIQVSLESGRQQQEDHKDEQTSYHSALEEKVACLTATNANLSSLNAVLSSDLHKSQSTVNDLQNEVFLLRGERFSVERRYGSYDEPRVQIELQTELIRRLGLLLGRREEQLENERRMMKLYREKISALEDEVEILKTDWEKLLPLVMPKNKGPILTTIEIDKNK